MRLHAAPERKFDRPPDPPQDSRLLVHLLLLTFIVATTPIQAELNLTDWDVSFVLGKGLAFTAVGGFVGGALGDRYGRKPLLMVTILIAPSAPFAVLAGLTAWLLPETKGTRLARAAATRTAAA